METKMIDIELLTAVFPPEALAQREGGSGKFFTYIKTHAVINRLNRACSYQWDFRIIEQHFEGPILVCRGELTIPGLGTRAQVGVQKVSPNGGEDLLKGAASDCLKKCASLFGVGIELYGDDVEADDYTPPARQSRPAQQPYQSPAPPRFVAPRPGAPTADNQAVESQPAELRNCYKCQQTVRMALENGKQERYDADGGQHFKTCGKKPTGYADIDPFAEGN